MNSYDYYDMLTLEGWDPIMDDDWDPTESLLDTVKEDNRLDPLSADYDPGYAAENENYNDEENKNS